MTMRCSLWSGVLATAAAAAGCAGGDGASPRVQRPGTLAQETAARWHPANPGGGGWFERVAAGPDGTVIACSDLSGAYRSRDRGAHWECLGVTRGLTVTHTACVAFHPTDAAVLLLGTDRGIFASADGGDRFEQVLSRGYVEHIASAPSDANVAYAAWHATWNGTDGRIQRSLDGGDTWQLMACAGLPQGRRLVEVVVAADDADELYVLAGEGRFARGPRGIFRSLDGGASFAAVHGAWADRLVDMALDPHVAGGLYATVDDPDPRAAGWLLHSADRGATWERRAQRGGFVWPDRSRAGTVRTVDGRYPYPWDARQGIWESTESGAAGTFRRISSVAQWNASWSTAHWSLQARTNHGAFGEDFSDPAALYWVNKQFVYGTFDAGRSTAPLFSDGSDPAGYRSRGIDNAVIVDVEIDENDPELVFAAFFDLGLWRSRDGGSSWTPLNEPSATGRWREAGGNTWCVLTDPARPGVVWAPQGPTPRDASTLLRSEDHGDTWSVVGRGLPAEPVLGLSLDRASDPTARTLLCTAGGDVYGSDDDGVTWTLRLAQGGLRTTAIDRHDARVVYAGGEGGLWVSRAAGAVGSWQQVGGGAMRGPHQRLPHRRWVGTACIVSDPTVRGRTYAVVHGGAAGGLYRSDDFGATWGTVLLRDPHLWSLAVDPEDAGVLALASSSAFNDGGYREDSRGVLLSDDGGRTWREANQGLPWPFAVTVALSGDRLWIGSPGAGVHWRTR